MPSPLPRRLLLPLSILLLLALSAGCTTVPAEPPPKKISPQEITEALYERARVLYLSKDYADAASLMQVLAGRGHLESQYVLGYMYYYGQGLPRNEKEALRWITTAAVRGHPKAQEALRRLQAEESLPGNDQGSPDPR